MQAIDYSKLLDSPTLRAVVPQEAIQSEGLYSRGEGIQFRLNYQAHPVLQEMVRLGDEAFLFASENSTGIGEPYRQVVSDSDWVHIQFRLNGGGHETFLGAGVLQTPERSCIVARYPKDAVLERFADTRHGWKVACLFVHPRALARLLDVSTERFPQSLSWLFRDDCLDLRASVLPLQSSMILAVSDILACRFRGLQRRAFMRAKSLELLATVLDALDESRPEATFKLSSTDFQRIAQARHIITTELESTLTLAELARRVGLNRTKLALGFKGVYGISVQACWRDARLDRARELLRGGEVPVTEIALRLGYSELSSFTRAFSRRFGVLPRNCRADGKRLLGKEPTKSV
jgi:AraC family transcriptional regulator, transcriptional activator of the genes for pyochelin and ferripyochelin receptors